MRASTALGMGWMVGAMMLSANAAEADSAFLLQLGSFPSEEAAQAKWATLQKEHGDVLGSLPNRVASVPVGEGKSIYRLQAGPISERAAANKACAALKESKLDCYLVETATLSDSTPKQALSAVRVSDNDELQLGKEAGQDNNLVTLDASMPRMAAMNPPPAKAEPRISFEDKPPEAPKATETKAEEPANPTPPAGDDAAEKPNPASLSVSEAKTEPKDAAPKQADWKALPKPAPMQRTRQAHYKLQQESAQTASPAEPDESHTFVAPSDAPTMGSLGTLRLRQDGEILGASTPKTAPVPVPAAQTTAVSPRLARQIAAPSDAAASSSSAPQSIPLFAPPPVTLSQAVPTSRIPYAANIRPSAPAGVASTSGGLTDSTDPNARVEVREAVPVDANALAPNLVPVSPEQPISAPPITVYAPPAAWRGTPGQAAPVGSNWAQFGHFINEETAFAFMDDLATRYPELTKGVRVRALRPLLNRGLGRHVALRVGPYNSQAEVDQLCALITRMRQPCTIVQETGVPADATEGRNINELRTRAELQQQVPPGTGALWVQLGSYRTESEAYNRFSSILSRQPKMLNGMRPSVTKPRSNSGEPVYRLRVGPFMDQSMALGFCSNLAQSGTSCVLVRD